MKDLSSPKTKRIAVQAANAMHATIIVAESTKDSGFVPLADTFQEVNFQGYHDILMNFLGRRDIKIE